ncbi:putative aldehyde dehydrogenase [Aspergillus clavatus NRRL 1]|uniref:Aldehyde dehydrogenase n=1 Tax=Aspergillus clavatus (strain ATCC 1007 / CBS 513.65 / DSM 816 / NCTC 3887 / NRRL 1 / QM 1276 / 107) TaxID=344612 RepID=A1CCP5_ASPCL|nr:aldehyde dehydrogenase [Aspergillus clavatus NRRL 1]EAW12302.1 aldehyde dehydrogenase [Aspergillus clavatus NRRL 1]
MASSTVPLIIHGEDIVLPSGERHGTIAAQSPHGPKTFQGATKDLAVQAVETCARAFPSWSKTSPAKRRELLLKVADLVRQRREEIQQIVEEETHCGQFWAQITTQAGADLIEETAALINSARTGSIPPTEGDSYGLVFKEPLGVILGIAPWNAPVTLGLRAVVAPIAAGNVAVFKGSELSPRTHYLLASLFRDAGFPPGVVNFVLHKPDDAAEVFEVMISHPAVKKCNFTGSTEVGRIIGSKAAYALKLVLLELGGKNYALVLDDADLDHAAQQIVLGAFLNNGQICMSTDLVIASKAISSNLESKILALVKGIQDDHMVISKVAKNKLNRLVADAQSKGASVHSAATSSDLNNFPATFITGLTREMDFYRTESFGPVMGMVVVDSEQGIAEVIKDFSYGLSSAIFTRNHYNALQLAESISAGAVHINSMTVHDEATLPHGGHGHSGWGRFGAGWGLEEFVQTKTVTLKP